MFGFCDELIHLQYMCSVRMEGVAKRIFTCIEMPF